jgi:hypothetical protein
MAFLQPHIQERIASHSELLSAAPVFLLETLQRAIEDLFIVLVHRGVIEGVRHEHSEACGDVDLGHLLLFLDHFENEFKHIRLYVE